MDADDGALAMTAEGKAKLLKELGKIVQDSIRLRLQGSSRERWSKASAEVDRAMRALLDAGALTRAELLRWLRAERCAVEGPALRCTETSRGPDYPLVAAGDEPLAA